MGKRGSTPPPAPDYAGIAQQQAQMQRQNMDAQTRANRPNQIGPWGSTTWSQDAAGNWTQSTQLAQPMQRALDQQMSIQNQRSSLANNVLGRVAQDISRPFDLSGAPALASAPQAMRTQGTGQPNAMMVRGGPMQMGIGSTPAYMDSAGDALFQRQASRLDPRFQQQEQALRSRLINSGITEGSEAWNTAFGNFGRERNDAYANAARDAITMAGSEASRFQGMDLNAGNFANAAQQQRFAQDLSGTGQFFDQQMRAGDQRFQQDLTGQNQFFNQQLAGGQFQNQAREQAIREALLQRGQSMNEMNALLTGQQVQAPQFQGFQGAGLYQTPDMMGAAQSGYQAQLDAFNARQASRNSFTGGLFSLGGAALGGPMGGMIGGGVSRAFGF